MKRSLLEIYALAVCFVAVISVGVLSGFALYDVAQIAAPAFTLPSYQWKYYQSNERFRAWFDSSRKVLEGLSDEQVTKRRQDEYAAGLSVERHDGEKGLLRMVLFILVGVVAFVLHWKVAKRARDSFNT